MFMDSKTKYKGDDTSQIDLYFQQNFYPNPRQFFLYRSWQCNPKIHMEIQGTQNSLQSRKITKVGG